MKLLVTGGAGFIGSHTCVELLSSGHEIVILDNLSNSKIEAVNRIKKIANANFDFVKGDILDSNCLDSIFTNHKIDAVIHFAGLKAVGESVSQPLKYYENNVSGTVELCKAMSRHNCKKMVFSSSATVYGNVNQPPFTEDMPLSTINPYGATKLMIEGILNDLAFSDSEWSVALLRYFNPVGAHESGLIGEDPEGIPNNLLPYVARVAVGKLPHINVFGDDYDTKDGTGVRDYIHVVDLAKGHVLAVNSLNKKQGAHAYNLGTGIGYSVKEIIAAFSKACGKELPYVIAPRRAGDAPSSFADASKALNELGWKAEFDIDRMSADGWRFIKNNPNGITE